MRIGVLGGTGPAGIAVAARLASVGLDVIIGSRQLERAQDTCGQLRDKWPDRDLPLRPAINPDAADADLVIVATPWDAAAATAASLAAHLQGKVVVSMANALARVGDEFIALIPPRGSVAASVQAAIPGALVSAALHHLAAAELGALGHDLDADVLVCSDAPEATRTTSELIAKVQGLRALDAGSLSNAAAIEALTPVLLNINMRYKTRSSIRLTGIEA